MSQIFGWIGMALIIEAYYLLANKKTTFDALNYNLLNTFGGFFIVISAISTGLWPVVVLNLFWTLIALKAVLQRWVK